MQQNAASGFSDLEIPSPIILTHHHIVGASNGPSTNVLYEIKVLEHAVLLDGYQGPSSHLIRHLLTLTAAVDFLYLRIVLDSLIFLGRISLPIEHETLYGLVLLTAVRLGYSGIVRSVLGNQVGSLDVDCQERSRSTSTYDSIASLALAVAKSLLEGKGGDYVDEDTSSHFWSGLNGGEYYSWIYQLLEVPCAAGIQSSWIALFAQAGINTPPRCTHPDCASVTISVEV